MAQMNPFDADEVVVQFITINGYSNNLYIDNISAGNQFALDAAVISINNIDPDTSYTVGSSSFIIQPNVTVSNLGSTNITSSFDVVMTVDPGGYSSTMPVASLNSGESAVVTFDDLTITPGTGIDITVTSQLSSDENPENDVMTQYSIILPGVQRANVLFEEWTNTSCSPCASNNPTIDAFVAANFSTIVPVKYHVWWPGINDPMYQYNIPEATNRTEYYGVGGVPHVIIGGEIHPVYPYTTPGSLQDAYDEQMSKGTPLEVSVTDTYVAGDSIRADVTLTLHAPLLAGDYRLRVMAVERWIHYNSPPGSNGEMDFYDVFRKAYPDIIGTTIPTTTGTYNYTFTYPIDMAVWVDSMIYTIAFVQDDVSKKVWGSDKGRDVVMDMNVVNLIEFVEKPVARPYEMSNHLQSIFGELDDPMEGFNVELFEGAFPPAGWQLINPDGGITFEQYEGANGPTLGGSKSVMLDFFSYSSTGASDTMNTRIFTGLEPTDSVKFDYAHAEYPGYGPDRLIVRVSVDGGQTFPHTIFDKAGAELATVPETSSNFIPANNGEWATFSYSFDGIVSSVENLDENISTGFSLAQNYPNPFNPTTKITYAVPKQGPVLIKVYDLTGQEVAILVDEVMEPGTYEISFEALNFSSGVYFYQMRAGDYTSVKKMSILK
jgi:hypothetical protein